MNIRLPIHFEKKLEYIFTIQIRKYMVLYFNFFFFFSQTSLNSAFINYTAQSQTGVKMCSNIVSHTSN